MQIIRNLKKGRSTAFGQHVTKKVEVTKLHSATGTHSFSEEEKVSFVEHMNQVLKGNPMCDARLPIDPNNMDLFTKVKDGILLW